MRLVLQTPIQSISGEARHVVMLQPPHLARNIGFLGALEELEQLGVDSLVEGARQINRGLDVLLLLLLL